MAWIQNGNMRDEHTYEYQSENVSDESEKMIA